MERDILKKAAIFSKDSLRYAFIRNHREAFPVGLMCRVLEVGKSGFYAGLKRPESPRSEQNRKLLV